MKKQSNISSCVVCGQECRSGIVILGTRICPQCEASLVESKVTQPGYDTYAKKLKVIWRNLGQAGSQAKGVADTVFHER